MYINNEPDKETDSKREGEREIGRESEKVCEAYVAHANK